MYFYGLCIHFFFQVYTISLWPLTVQLFRFQFMQNPILGILNILYMEYHPQCETGILPPPNTGFASWERARICLLKFNNSCRHSQLGTDFSFLPSQILTLILQQILPVLSDYTLFASSASNGVFLSPSASFYVPNLFMHRLYFASWPLSLRILFFGVLPLFLPL